MTKYLGTITDPNWKQFGLWSTIFFASGSHYHVSLAHHIYPPKRQLTYLSKELTLNVEANTQILKHIHMLSKINILYMLFGNLHNTYSYRMFESSIAQDAICDQHNLIMIEKDYNFTCWAIRHIAFRNSRIPYHIRNA